MAALLKTTQNVAKIAAWTGGAALLFISVVVGIDVVLRKAFSVTLGGADEFSGYVFGISTTWALSYTLLHRGHIRIDVVYNYLSASAKAALDVISLVSMGAAGGIVAFYSYDVLERSYELGSKANTPLATPLWMPQALWFAGFMLFLWTLLLLLALTVAALMRGQTDKVARLAGIPSVDDDVQAALDDVTTAPGRD